MNIVIAKAGKTPGDIERLGIIDYAKVLWCTRYYEVGDFELHLPVTPDALDLLQMDRYVLRDDDEKIGVIERIELQTTSEDGDYMTVSGRFIESFLDRRIIDEQTTVNGKLKRVIQSLLMNHVIYPSKDTRTIRDFHLGPSEDVNYHVEAQYTGDNLLKVVQDLCQKADAGFKVTYQNGRFLFSMYTGTDRSYAQTENPWVVFSDKNENLISASCVSDKKEFRNYALVAGEGEGKERRTTYVLGNGFHLWEGTRELYVDARDISSNNKQLTDAEYTAALKQRGAEKLAATQITFKFDGDADPGVNYTYKKDYFLGDQVTVENAAWGISKTVRILEVLECFDDEGYSVTPTFGG